MLTWLADQVKYLWSYITQTANNAWRWACEQANSAYNRAVSWASSAVENAKVFLRGLVDAARRFAVDLYNEALRAIISAWNSVAAYARQLFDEAKAVAVNLFNQVGAAILYWYNRAVGAAQGLVNGVVSLARALFDRAILAAADAFDRAVGAAQAIVDGVANTITALVQVAEQKIEQVKKDIGITSPEAQTGLLAFVTDPIGTILAWLLPILLEIMEFVLGYALGTEEATLPPWPDWGKKGYGGVILPGIGPPPDASGLASPLDYLRISGYTFGNRHYGIDLGLPVGTPVYAMHSGTVVYAAWDKVEYGLTVCIRGDGWWTRYAHLSQIGVAVGQQVGQRHTIGLGGSTGNSTGPHLHLEVKYDGKFIDPITVLPIR